MLKTKEVTCKNRRIVLALKNYGAQLLRIDSDPNDNGSVFVFADNDDYRSAIKIIQQNMRYSFY